MTERLKAGAEDANARHAPRDAGDKAVYFEGELASRGMRLLAAVINSLPVVVVAALIALTIGDREWSLVFGLVVTVLSGLAYLAIQIVLLVTRAQDLGKMLLGLRIVDYTSNRKGNPFKLLGRAFLPAVVSTIPFVGFLAFVNVLFIFGEERRCLHDYVFGTKVVKP